MALLRLKLFRLVIFLCIHNIGATSLIRFNRTKTIELSDSLNELLLEIARPMRVNALVCWDLETAHTFANAFHGSEQQPSKYQPHLLGIFPDDIRYFPYDVDAEHHEMMLIDLACSENAKQLIQSTQSKMTFHFKWVFVHSGDEDVQTMHDTLESLLADCPILPRSEIFMISRTDDVILYQQVYRVALSEPLLWEIFGTVTENDVFVDARGADGAVKRRQNLYGITLRASMVITNNDTIHHLNDYVDKHIDTITKSNYVLTNYLVSFVNASVRYSTVSSWGYRNGSTGLWDGMIGELVQNEADIGASALFMTDDRAGTIQYISMPSPTGSMFIFRAPKLSYTDNVFLLPFDDFVWLCLMALVFVTAVFLMIATFAEWKVPLATLNQNDSGVLHPSIGDVFLLVFGATCQQGSSVEPRSITSRVIMWLVFTILMFLYTSYSANIVALLQSPSRKIRTLRDLFESRLKLGVDDTVYNHYFFTHQTEPLRKKIFEQKITNHDGTMNFLNFRDGIRRVREGLYAFHVERSVGYQLISETFYEDEKCGLQGISFFQMTDPWYAIQKNSSYHELLISGMMRMHEHGLQDRENSRLYTKEPKCAGAGGHFVTASLVDTGPAMLVLLWGFGIAASLLLAEICYARIYVARKLRRAKGNRKSIPFVG